MTDNDKLIVGARKLVKLSWVFTVLGTIGIVVLLITSKDSQPSSPVLLGILSPYLSWSGYWGCVGLYNPVRKFFRAMLPSGPAADIFGLAFGLSVGICLGVFGVGIVYFLLNRKKSRESTSAEQQALQQSIPV